MQYRLIITAVVAFVLGASLLNASPTQAQDVFCDYVATVTFTNDLNEGRELTSVSAGLQFPMPSIINGLYINFPGLISEAHGPARGGPLAAGESLVHSFTARANNPPIGVRWGAVDVTLPIPVLAMVSAVSHGYTVSNCGEAGSATPGVQTGGFPLLVVPMPTDDQGGVTWTLWDFDVAAGKGFPALSVTNELIKKFPAKPVTNTVIATSADGKVRFSILSSGEYQVNYGPDIEGKESVVIFDAFGTLIRKYDFNLYSLGR